MGHDSTTPSSGCMRNGLPSAPGGVLDNPLRYAVGAGRRYLLSDGAFAVPISSVASRSPVSVLNRWMWSPLGLK